MYICSVLGLRRYFPGKVHIPHQTSASNTAGVSKDLKKILHLSKSTANAALYADVTDWWSACPNCVDMDNLAAASCVFSIANASTVWARVFFSIYG